MGVFGADPVHPAAPARNDRVRTVPPRPSGGRATVRASGVVHLHDGEHGIRHLDLEVRPGTIFGLVGPSGAGKTTAVRLLLGLLPPQEGELEVLGRSPATFTSDERARIGYLPQHVPLYPELSLRHNLNMVASLYGMPWRGRFWPKGRRGKAARRRIAELLDLMDLDDRAGTRLGQASGGEQRRLALAAALVHDPDLVVLDEPTAGIDPVLRKRLWEVFGDLRDEGRTLVVTTQYVEESAHCDLVGVLVDGHVAHVGTPDELRRRAADPDTGEEPDRLEEVFVRLVEQHRARTGAGKAVRDA